MSKFQSIHSAVHTAISLVMGHHFWGGFTWVSALCAIFFAGSCQTYPIGVEGIETDTPSDPDSAPVDSDSEMPPTDWQYDTDDGTGGQDEPCYVRSEKGNRVVWCDSPDLVAQQCDDNDEQCCCRAICAAAICTGADTEVAPCDYVDLANPKGFCTLAADAAPVTYSCDSQCTPRSSCRSFDADGRCLDASPVVDGHCFLYQEDMGVTVRCQRTCTMSFCDTRHMCVPLYDATGNFSNRSACTLIK